MPDAAPLDLATLPEDIRGEPSLAAFKTIPDLAKSYVSAQKMIGTNRLPEPQATWTEKEWGDLYGRLGRPDAPDKYEMPKDVKMAEGLTIDPEKTKVAFTELHKLGLSKKQAEGVMRYYMGTINSTQEADTQMRLQSLATGTETLKKTHGDKYDAVVATARGVLHKFGGDEFTKFLSGAQLDNNPQMVEFLYKIGQTMSEDTMRMGGTPPIMAGDQATAMNEIKRLESDSEFQKAYNDKYHIAHQEAVDKILYLNRIAAPGKVQS